LELFKKYALDRKTIYELNQFSTWEYSRQIEFGKTLFMLLVRIYKDISHIAHHVEGNVAPQDLTLLGRKLSSSLKKKPGKIPILPKPLDRLNLPSLTIRFNDGIWQIFPGNESSAIISEKSDLVYCIAYLVWNGLYFPGLLRMLPNRTPVTMPEIIHLSGIILKVFGVYDISSIEFQNFLQPERTEKMLIVINFAQDPDVETISTLHVLTVNNWGEFYIYRFRRPEKFISYLENISKNTYHIIKYYHNPKHSRHGDKILEKTKHLVSQYLGVKSSE